MKRLKKNQQKDSHASATHAAKKPRKAGKLSLFRFSKAHLLIVTAVVAVIGGSYAVYSSFAATDKTVWATFVVYTRDASTAWYSSAGVGKIPGSTVTVKAHWWNGGVLGADAGTPCEGGVMSKSSTNGSATFKCKIISTNGSSIRYVLNVSANGYNNYVTNASGQAHAYGWIYADNGVTLSPTQAPKFYVSFMVPKPPAPQPQAPSPQPPTKNPQPPAPKPQPQPSQPSSNRSSSSTVVQRPRPAPVDSSDDSDTTPPSAPGSLTATSQGGAVVLTWEASIDNKGVAGYVVERSTDGENWEILNDNVTETSFTDSTASFGAKYSYRVSAMDESGNGSDYAVVDITTSEFEANAFADKESTVESEDGNVTVKIPEGALPEDAFCKVETTQSETPEGYVLLAGVYSFTCKKKDGSTIESYNQPLEFTVKAEEGEKSKLAFLDGDQWQYSDDQYNAEVQGYTFSSDQPRDFAVFAPSKKGMNWLLLIFGIFLLLLVLFGLILWLLRRRQSQQEQTEGYNLDYFDNYMQQADQQPTDQQTDYSVTPDASYTTPPTTVVTPAVDQAPIAPETPTSEPSLPPQQPMPAAPEMPQAQPQPPSQPPAVESSAAPATDDYANKQYPEQPYR